jgi:putative oxidoreductase
MRKTSARFVRGRVPFDESGESPAMDWSPLILRAIVGCGFMIHGFAKWSRGSSAFAGVLDALGVPMPYMSAWATILVEMLGGFAVLAGAFVKVASVPMIAVLLVALFTVHLPYGFSSIKLIAITNGRPEFGPPGYETALLYVACLAALVLGGSGPLSVDGLIARSMTRHRDDAEAAGVPR